MHTSTLKLTLINIHTHQQYKKNIIKIITSMGQQTEDSNLTRSIHDKFFYNLIKIKYYYKNKNNKLSKIGKKINNPIICCEREGVATKKPGRNCRDATHKKKSVSNTSLKRSSSQTPIDAEWRWSGEKCKPNDWVFYSCAR